MVMNIINLEGGLNSAELQPCPTLTNGCHILGLGTFRYYAILAGPVEIPQLVFAT